MKYPRAYSFSRRIFYVMMGAAVVLSFVTIPLGLWVSATTADVTAILACLVFAAAGPTSFQREYISVKEDDE